MWGLCGLLYALPLEASISLTSFLGNLQQLLSSTVATPVLQTLGQVLAHRAYEPATPMGPHHFGLGIEATLVSVPPSTLNQIHQNSSGSLALALPSVKILNLHKGLSETMDLGFSLFYYTGFTFYGFDWKWAFYQPTEGATWAFRLNYHVTKIFLGTTTSNLGIEIDLNLKTSSWAPELLISKKLDFADPYLGIGYRSVHGTLQVEAKNIPAALQLALPSSPSVSTGGAYSFLGLSFVIPNLGLQWVLEGSYHWQGYHALGTKVGFCF